MKIQLEQQRLNLQIQWKMNKNFIKMVESSFSFLQKYVKIGGSEYIFKLGVVCLNKYSKLIDEKIK